MAALDGLHVAERTRGLAATFAGHLLAGLGARVWRVDPSPFPILDRRKRSGVAADPDVALADEQDEPDGAPIGCRVRAW
ncbi:MAG: hypothetical protein ACREQL_04685, partial [Candidatus Binatia bacterium]